MFPSFLQINGEDVCAIKVPKEDLWKLSKEDAIELALKDKNLQDNLRDVSIRDINYKTNYNYDSVLNIRLAHHVKKKKVKAN